MITKIRKGELAAHQARGMHPAREAHPKGRTFVEALQEARTGSAKRMGKAPTVHQRITMTQAARLAYFSPIIHHCAQKYGVPVPLICGVMLQESGGNPHAVSPAGARGLMQLMPATARRMGVSNIMDPRQNIEGGVRYLRLLLERFRGDIRLAVAGYNCGEGNIAKYGNRIPPFAETQAYVPNVLAFADTVHRILNVGDVRVRSVTPAPAASNGAVAKRLIKLT